MKKKSTELRLIHVELITFIEFHHFIKKRIDTTENYTTQAKHL